MKGGQRRMLRRCGRGEKNILRQPIQGIDIRFRRDQPTETPSRHAEIFGETIDHEHIIAQRQRGFGIPAIGEAMINLIHHQRTAAR